MHESIEQAIQHLDAAKIHDYFSTIKEVIPEKLNYRFNELRGRFMAQDTPWNFEDQLRTFADVVNDEITRDSGNTQEIAEQLPVQSARPKRVFISFYGKDKPFRDELFDQIKVYEQNGKITIWDHSMLVAGEEISNSINHLHRADIIVLLISSEYLANDSTYSIDFDTARSRHENKQSIVIPVIVKSCLWDETWLNGLNCLPQKPVVSYSERSQAWLEVAKGLRTHI